MSSNSPEISVTLPVDTEAGTYNVTVKLPKGSDLYDKLRSFTNTGLRHVHRSLAYPKERPLEPAQTKTIRVGEEIGGEPIYDPRANPWEWRGEPGELKRILDGREKRLVERIKEMVANDPGFLER